MDAAAKHKNSATMPHRKIKVKTGIRHILRLPGVQRVIIYSWGGSFRVWDLEKGTQLGEEWEDKEFGVWTMALSPGGKTAATGNVSGAVKLWNIDTGKVIKEWTGQTNWVQSVCWSPDEGRVVSGILAIGLGGGMFTVRDVESGPGETILGPIRCKSGNMNGVAVCYSPDGKMIATGGFWLKIWDANTGELLKTMFEVTGVMCLAWTSDGETLIAGGCYIRKCDTATWTVVLDVLADSTVISLSPNERILASTLSFDKTVQLWNLETNKSIGTLHHEDRANAMTFSTDGKFLVTGCNDGHLHTWDVSAIVKESGLLLDISDATPRPAPKMKGARRIPPGFFDQALREANLRIRLSQSHGPHYCPTPVPRQRTLSSFSSFWRRSKPHGANERDIQSRSRPLSSIRNLVSGILRRRDGSDIQLREVEVPCTWAKPRNYHARKKPAAISSRPSNTRNTQQHSTTTQSTLSSSQQPPPTANTSTLSAVPGIAEATGTTSGPRITIDSGFRTRFMLWICCVSIQSVDGHH